MATSAQDTATSIAKVLLTVEEAAQALGLGRTYVYSLVVKRSIQSVKVGRRRRIPLAALHDFVARQLMDVER
jgi:excisionase family DNA binding protein